MRVRFLKNALVSILVDTHIGVLLPFYFFHRNFTREIIAESRQDAIEMEPHPLVLSSGKSPQHRRVAGLAYKSANS